MATTERINQIPTTATSFASDDYLPIDGTTNGTRKILGSPILLKDSNNNITVNNVFEGFSSITASGTTVTLTIASPENFVITGSGGQVIKLPDATTLSNGTDFLFNNNQSSGTITVQNNSGTTVCTLQSGSYIIVTLLSNSNAAGTWDYHNSAPSNASWSTNTLSWAGSYTSGTWNGNAVGVLYGGAGAAGGNSVSSVSGVGGIGSGIFFPVSNSTVYYAGGGGGGAYGGGGGSGGAGGSGGGGTGSTGTGSNGTINTGGGGGGGGQNTNGGQGGSGYFAIWAHQ